MKFHARYNGATQIAFRKFFRIHLRIWYSKSWAGVEEWEDFKEMYNMGCEL